MNRKKIKILFLEKDLKFTDLATEYGCGQSAISHFISGNFKSKDLAKFLAKKLGIKTKELMQIQKVA